jgi:enterochelin esterase-like enzyme
MKYFFILFSIFITTNSKTQQSNSIQHTNLYGETISCFNSKQEKAVILFLNGYNFSVQKAINESNFIENALKRGYSLVIPEVKKTVYAKKNYPESAEFLISQKKLNYFTDTLIAQFINNNYKGKPIFIYGLSTGARGTLLIAVVLQDKINAIALLSGDFDQTLNTSDNLMKAAFGPFEKYPKRWQEEENPIFSLQQLKASTYIYHSKADKIVPFEHSKQLNARLIQLKKENLLDVESNQNHDFEAWNSKTNNILDFFDEKIEK